MVGPEGLIVVEVDCVVSSPDVVLYEGGNPNVRLALLAPIVVQLLTNFSFFLLPFPLFSFLLSQKTILLASPISERPKTESLPLYNEL